MNGGTLLNLAPTTDPKVYTATFIPATNTQNVAALIEVAAGAYTDAAGNDGAAASLALNGDTLVPALTIGADGTTLKAGEQTTLTFSEIPQDFVAGDIAVTGGTLSGFAVSADPKVYTATFTPAASNALAASVSVPGGACTDAIGNAGAASNTVNIGGDTLAPSVVGSAGGIDRIYRDEGNDIVFGGQGDDYIDGGTGRDTLRLMGASRAEYTMRIKDGAVVMTHLKPDADGTDIVANVELLQYAGQAGTVDFNQSLVPAVPTPRPGPECKKPVSFGGHGLFRNLWCR